MKKYTRPTVEIVELESRQNMADVNPIVVTTANGDGTDTVTTIYNLALVGASSLKTTN